METPRIVSFTEAERKHVMATAMLAFADDPMIRWFFRDSDAYLDSMPAFDAFCGGAITTQSAYRTEDYEGVVLWHPPGHGPAEEAFLESLQRLARPDSLERIFRVFELMEQSHPDEICWYLPVIGVDAIHQGR